MMGAFHFVRAANKAGIKPIVGSGAQCVPRPLRPLTEGRRLPHRLARAETRDGLPPVGQAQLLFGLHRRLLLRAAH